MSSGLQRARPQMIGPCTSRATAWTLSKSPREAAGKPASMTSTPSSSSARATRSFSGGVMLQPGDCSPSRSVVSKIRTRSGWIVMGRTSGAPFVEPRHSGPERGADFLDLPVQVVGQQLLVVRLACLVLPDPLACELAALHLFQDLAHL